MQARPRPLNRMHASASVVTNGKAVMESVLASHAVPQRVCSTFAQGYTKAASHAVRHNVAHAPSKVADLVSSAYLILVNGDWLF